MLKRIKYVSRFAKPMDAKQLDKLAKDSARRNKKQSITGILMVSGQLFFQVIEGPAKKIEDLYWNILNDTRHVDVVTLSIEDNVEDRLFPDWSMKVVVLDTASDIRNEPLEEIMLTIIKQQYLIDRLGRVLERALWHDLVSAGAIPPKSKIVLPDLQKA